MTTKGNRKTRRAVASAARKGKTPENVVPLRAKAGLKMTEDERLRFENFTLKLDAVQARATAEASIHVAQRVELSKRIGKRLGVAMDAYNVDLETGELIPVNGGPEQAAAPPRPEPDPEPETESEPEPEPDAEPGESGADDEAG